MKLSLFKTAALGLLGLTFLALFSCASPRKADYLSPNFDPVAIKTIGLFPITYDEKYGPPLRPDIKGHDLSRMLTRHVERALTDKGYKLKQIDYPAGIAEKAPFISVDVDPTDLAGNFPPGVDGVMQVHVTFHFGINPIDYSNDDGPHEGISLYATARLIEGKGLTEAWRDSGRARPFSSSHFSTRLNFAAYTLAEGLFKTLPDRKATK